MPFTRRITPINQEFKDKLDQRFTSESTTRQQAIQNLQDQIDALKRNTSVSDMPDYLNARVAWSLTDHNGARRPIIKINAPCWILITSAGRGGDNQDATITIGPSVSAWNNQLTEKLIGLQGVCSDDFTGGSFMAPVFPGTSTYAAANWHNGACGTYMIVIPTVSVTRFFDQNSIDYSRLYTNTGSAIPGNVTFNRNKIAIPGSNEWREIFQGNWRDNF